MTWIGPTGRDSRSPATAYPPRPLHPKAAIAQRDTVPLDRDQIWPDGSIEAGLVKTPHVAIGGSALLSKVLESGDAHDAGPPHVDRSDSEFHSLP